MLRTNNTDGELRAVLQEILRADQSDANHSRAINCFDQLLNLEREYLGTKLAPDYFNILSILTFHIGQAEAFNSGSSEAALGYFKKSFEYAKSALASWQRLGSTIDYKWIAYVEATVAYFEGDVYKIAELKGQCCSGNQLIVESLLSGLTASGTPNYARDYSRRAN